MNVEIRTTEKQDGTVDVVIYINGKFFDCKNLNKKEIEFYEIKDKEGLMEAVNNTAVEV